MLNRREFLESAASAGAASVLLSPLVSVIKREAIGNGLRTLRMDGLNKVRDGVTTIDEVLRVTQKDEI